MVSYPLLNLCVQVNTGCRLQERRGRDHCIDLCICILFSETINRLLITFIYIVHLNSEFSYFDLFLWSGFLNIAFKSSIYIMKSWAILGFLKYICGFHPCLLWNPVDLLRICFLVHPWFYNIKGIFDFSIVCQ